MESLALGLTIYRTEAVWKARSCRCLPHPRTPCRRASCSPAPKRRPPVSASRHAAPYGQDGLAGAPTDPRRLWGGEAEVNDGGEKREAHINREKNFMFVSVELLSKSLLNY